MVHVLKRECMEHPYRFSIGFFLIYVCGFFGIEALNLPAVWHISCPLDDRIPFVKYAIIPYCAWFLWLLVGTLHLTRSESGETRWRVMAPMYAGLLMILLFCLLVPNGIDLRPDRIEGNDLCAVLVRLIEGADNPNNVCPSMHVYSTIFLDLGVQKSTNLKGKAWKPCARILDIAICCSTMLLKQHSIVDVAVAFGFAWMMDHAAERAIVYHRTLKRSSFIG